MRLKRVEIADASALIALQRRFQLPIFLLDKEVFLTERVYRELVTIPLERAKNIRSDELRKKILLSVKEIGEFIHKGNLQVKKIDYKIVGSQMDAARKRQANITGERENEIATDHTIIGLVLEMIQINEGVIVYSNDKALNQVLEEFIQREQKENSVKIKIIV